MGVSTEREPGRGAHHFECVVRAVGLEPTRRCHRGILSPLRLPVPPRPLWSPNQILSAFSGQVELTSSTEARLFHNGAREPKQSLNADTRACFTQPQCCPFMKAA